MCQVSSIIHNAIKPKREKKNIHHEEYKIDTPIPRQYDGPDDPPPALCVEKAAAVFPDECAGCFAFVVDVESESADSEPGPMDTPAVTSSDFNLPSHRMRMFQD